jgi:hypothetical protein
LFYGMRMIGLRYGRLILLAVLLLTGSASAQELRLTLTMSPKPSPYISEWQSRKETATLTVINPTGKSVDAKLRAKVTLDDAMRAETKNEAMPIIAIPPGISTYAADQLFPGDAVRFAGGIDKTATKTGMLPAGVYQLCVDLIGPVDSKPLSTPACRQFSITSYQLPVLQLPENGKTLAATEKPTFRWTPVVPQPQGGVRYMLRLFEVLPGQSPASQLQNGIPLFEREVLALTQLIWPPELVLPEKSATYAWSVQTVDPISGNPIGDQNGYAEPFTFKTGTPADGGGGGGKSKGSGVSISGVVKDFYSDAAIPNALVVYHRVTRSISSAGKLKFISYKESLDSLTTHTDGSGSFTIEGATDSIFFSLAGSASGYVRNVEKGAMQYQQGSIAGYTMLLKPNKGSITGRIVDTVTGKPLNNITVELYRKATLLFRARKGVSGFSLLHGEDELVASVKTGNRTGAASSKAGGVSRWREISGFVYLFRVLRIQ